MVTKFYTVVKSSQKQALAPVYIVKCDIEQKSYSEVNSNETKSSNYTHGDFERAPIPIKNVDWLLCGFENWSFYVIS